MKLLNLFETPLLVLEKPEWVEKTIKITDQHINDSYKRILPELIKKREEIYGKNNLEKVKDFGASYHSLSLEDEKELLDLNSFIKKTSFDFLVAQGFNLKEYELFFTELWVQQFSKSGGGHHDTHFHWDNHISGFYFLKCSSKTSFPIFQDPRHGALMTKLPQQNENTKTYANEQMHIKPVPGTMIFFPSFLGHQFSVDAGIEDFRFIHFNLQAVRKKILKENYDLGKTY